MEPKDLGTMADIMGQRAAEGGNPPALDAEGIALAERKRWSLDDPPYIPADPLR